MNFIKGKETKQEQKNYFAQAKSWSDDVYGTVMQSRNRYQLAFFSSMALNIMAVFAVAVLAPMQTLIPMMVHHYENGVVTVEAIDNERLPQDKSQIESDIVRYIQNRESYDISSYKSQYDLVNLISSETVAKQYASEQEKSSNTSPIKLLGKDSYREVHVYNINFLDNHDLNEKEITKEHHNLAEVVFSLIDTDKSTGRKTSTHHSAMISWEYVKPSDVPAIRWQNFDGFLVTRYNKQLRNV